MRCDVRKWGAHPGSLVPSVCDGGDGCTILCIHGDDFCRISSLPLALAVELRRPDLAGVMLEIHDDTAESRAIK